MFEPKPEPILGQGFLDAATYAVELHAHQARKGTHIPYMTHLLAVASLVLEDDGTELEAMAGLLHDGPEDQGGQPILDEIRKRFGSEVARIVDGLSDSMVPKHHPKPAWRERKQAYIDRLEGESEAVLRVSLADKLHNARSIAVDHRIHGEDVWKRFHVGRGDQRWYFHELLRVFERRFPGSRNLPDFRAVVIGLFGEPID